MMSNVANMLANENDYIDTFAQDLIFIIQMVFIGIGALVLPFAIYLGFQMAYAADEGKRRETKKRLINILVSLLIIILLQGLLAVISMFVTFTPGEDVHGGWRVANQNFIIEETQTLRILRGNVDMINLTERHYAHIIVEGERHNELSPALQPMYGPTWASLRRAAVVPFPDPQDPERVLSREFQMMTHRGQLTNTAPRVQGQLSINIWRESDNTTIVDGEERRIMVHVRSFTHTFNSVARGVNIPDEGDGTVWGGGAWPGQNGITVPDLDFVAPVQLASRSTMMGIPGAQVRQSTGAGIDRPPVLPIRLPLISSDFGWRTHNGGEFHPGIDINRSSHLSGDGVFAISRGTVLSAGWSNSMGWFVALEHTPHLRSIYMHLDHGPRTHLGMSTANSWGDPAGRGTSIAPFIQAGASIGAGARIGTIGNTGASTGPHLHFELFRTGNGTSPAQRVGSIDPLSLVYRDWRYFVRDTTPPPEGGSPWDPPQPIPTQALNTTSTLAVTLLPPLHKPRRICMEEQAQSHVGRIFEYVYQGIGCDYCEFVIYCKTAESPYHRIPPD